MARPISGAGSSFWPTPTKHQFANRIELEFRPAGLRFKDDPTQAGSQFGIEQASRSWTLLWLVMKAFGAEPTGWADWPYSRPLHVTLRRGERSSPTDLTFNPSFSDWMMGWPIGWTDPRQPVTGWSAWLQHMRGALYVLLSKADERAFQ